MRLRWLFAVILLFAIVISVPLRLALSPAATVISAQSVEGTIWNGRLIGASLGGQPLGDLDARLSPGALFLGKARVRLDGARLHGAVVTSFGTRSGEISLLSLPIGRTMGPVELSVLEITDAQVVFHDDECVRAEGHMMMQIKSGFGGQRLSGSLRCSGAMLAADLVSQSAMQRLSLRFPTPVRYQALLTVKASDNLQAVALTAAGFRETPVGHVMKLAGTL